MPSLPVIYEDGVKAGLNINDFAFVDIPPGTDLKRRFDDEFRQHPIFDDGHADFFRVLGIDQHFGNHSFSSFFLGDGRNWIHFTRS